MVTLAQSSPGDRSARAPQSKTATVMLALVDNVSIFAGENLDDNINATGRVGDNTHLNATGGNTATSLAIAAITAITF